MSKFQENYTQWVFVWMVCNAKCAFCNAQVWISREFWYFNFYSLERIKRTIELKVIKWAKCIIYEWWDFSIHPNIFEILEFWKSLWINQTFQTNWLKLADIEYVKKLKNCWIDEMNFSIHSADEKNYDNIMWTKWWLKKAIKWVQNCVEIWMKVSNNLVLTKLNINQLEWVLLMMLKLKIKLLNITMYIPVDMKEDKFHKKFMVDPKIAWKKISEMLKLYNQISFITNWEIKIFFKFHNIWRCIIDKEYQNFNFQFDLDRRKNIDEYQYETWFYKKTNCINCKYNLDCTWFTQKYISFFWENYIEPIEN